MAAINVVKDEASRVLSSLIMGKLAGQDEMYSRLLKEAREEIGEARL